MRLQRKTFSLWGRFSLDNLGLNDIIGNHFGLDHIARPPRCQPLGGDLLLDCQDAAKALEVQPEAPVFYLKKLLEQFIDPHALESVERGFGDLSALENEIGQPFSFLEVFHGRQVDLTSILNDFLERLPGGSENRNHLGRKVSRKLNLSAAFGKKHGEIGIGFVK